MDLLSAAAVSVSEILEIWARGIRRGFNMEERLAHAKRRLYVCFLYTLSRLAGLNTLDLNHTPGSGVVCGHESPWRRFFAQVGHARRLGKASGRRETSPTLLNPLQVHGDMMYVRINT